MSCDYDVFCLDCEEALGIEDANHAAATMHALVREADAIAAAAPMLERLQRDADAELTVCFGRRLYLAWFVQHRGHRLAVRDEYGRIDGECSKWVDCACCGTGKRCRLAAGHAGPCVVPVAK